MAEAGFTDYVTHHLVMTGLLRVLDQAEAGQEIDLRNIEVMRSHLRGEVELFKLMQEREVAREAVRTEQVRRGNKLAHPSITFGPVTDE
jgi:hypothetical protein